MQICISRCATQIAQRQAQKIMCIEYIFSFSALLCRGLRTLFITIHHVFHAIPIATLANETLFPPHQKFTCVRTLRSMGRLR